MTVRAIERVCAVLLPLTLVLVPIGADATNQMSDRYPDVPWGWVRAAFALVALAGGVTVVLATRQETDR